MFITSSYSKRCFLASKFRPSILLCADSIAFETSLCSKGSSSGSPKVPIIPFMRSEPKIRIKSSSSETKNWDSPGSPCLPDRPRSWLSILRASCRSVPSTYNPPASRTSVASAGGFPPKIMSTPRPAILVASVTRPFLPACAIISASCSWFLAFKISCGIPSLLKIAESRSFLSIETVPIKTGWPFSCRAFTSLATALNFPASVWKTLSSLSILTIGRFVGISIASRL